MCFFISFIECVFSFIHRVQLTTDILLSFENSLEVDDHEVIPSIPSDFWLKGCKTRCVLAYMVYRTNKEIASIVAALTPGHSKEIQRNNVVARIVEERDTARKA